MTPDPTTIAHHLSPKCKGGLKNADGSKPWHSSPCNQLAAALREYGRACVFERIKQHVCWRPEASQVIQRVKAQARAEEREAIAKERYPGAANQFITQAMQMMRDGVMPEFKRLIRAEALADAIKIAEYENEAEDILKKLRALAAKGP